MNRLSRPASMVSSLLLLVFTVGMTNCADGTVIVWTGRFQELLLAAPATT
ncbi:hypothetical protein [Prescottella equi]|nr:hypothetical protein [Prescottella equi]